MRTRLAPWHSQSRGKGVPALFNGPSGTGKTMAAEALAAELGLDLFCVNLARVVSKYIGETERNVDRVSGTAESIDGIVLRSGGPPFGKPSEVDDSRDRYANLEVGHLPQPIEGCEGLAILTTNLRADLDPAEPQCEILLESVGRFCTAGTSVDPIRTTE